MTQPAAARGSRRQAVADQAGVAVGLGILGISAYAFLAAAGRALGPDRFAPLSVAWTVVFTISTGLLITFEQETGRSVAERAAAGKGARPVLRTSARVTGLVTLTLVAVLLVLRAPLADLLFRGDETLVVVTAAATVGMAAAYVSRGALAGLGRFGSYGLQLAVEGLVRGVGAVLLLVASAGGAAAFLWLLALAPAAAALTTAAPLRSLRPGPPEPVRAFGRHLVLLIATAALSNTIVNAGPVLVELLGPREGPASGLFLAALVVARAPLFVFAAVQAVVLPRLTRAHFIGSQAFRRELGIATTLVAGLGLAGIVGCGVLGPPLVQLFFGPAYQLERGLMVLLSIASAVYMLAVLLTQALIALRRHGSTVVCWSAGVVAAAAVTAAVPALETRVALGFLAGATGALLALGAAVWWLEPTSGEGSQP